jgi:16S rRNA (uracil1498-N3)-methyltransferase
VTHFHFFIDAEELSPGAIVTLEGPEFHHARDVLRIGPEESVNLINGRGSIASGVVEAIERHRCLIRILSSERHDPPSTLLSLGLSLLRPNHLDFAIEKGTEVGVDRFVLFHADRSERKDLPPSLQRRLDSILIAATKQSGRLFLPQICFASSLAEALTLLPSPHLWADLSVNATSLASRLSTLHSDQTPSILIGPESGWSDREREILSKNETPVLLHSNVLRAETAAIVGAYVLSQHIQASRGQVCRSP